MLLQQHIVALHLFIIDTIYEGIGAIPVEQQITELKGKGRTYG